MVAVAALAAGVTWAITNDEETTKTELYAEAATTTGPDPFTQSTAVGSAMVIATDVPRPSASAAAGTVTQVRGSVPGLYGGTQDNASCDRDQQISFLAQDPDKAAAFAGVLGISAGEIPEYIRSLTPVLLTVDTRVTNHGYVDGQATARQSVLQAGTAVLVDQYGMPRVRCYCGNPLTEPQPLTGDVTTTGDTWAGYSEDRFVAVIQTTVIIKIFVLIDVNTGEYFDRPSGSNGSQDTDHETTTTSRCAQQPDDAMYDLLANRRNEKRNAMSKCANETVVDYFFTLSDGFASTLSFEPCKPPSEIGLDSGEDAACDLSNNAIILFVKKSFGFYATGVVIVEVPPTSSPSSSPSATPQACGTGQAEFQTTSPPQQLLLRYFRALDRQDYASAFAILSDELQQNWAGIGPSTDPLTNFSAFFREHLRCVTVTSIRVASNSGDPTVSASLGIQWYEVSFDDEYISPFPAGSGELQPFYRVHSDPHQGPNRPDDRITGEATGL